MAALFRGQDEIAQKIADRVALVGVPPTTVAGPVDLIYGANCRPGPVRAADKTTKTGGIPQTCVFVYPIPSPVTTAYIGGKAADGEPSDWKGNYPDSFQIVARGRLDSEDSAFDLADACFRAIDKTTTAGYFAITAETRPQRLQRDELSAAEYVFTVTALRCQ